MDKDEQIRLMQEIIEQQNTNIKIQDERLAEKDATIADLRKMVDELQSLTANLEETLEEFRRQLFGTNIILYLYPNIEKIYGQVRSDVREIIKTLCQYKDVEIVDGAHLQTK